ncbi:helix-turn-helix transcriptional regulator [Nocardia sp. NPDC051832]|uniref:helix-turn-helix domain-containing protein n=1 Tax=Nocardia sp. NPDC051832 TaxID=3155673 RepID=UPI00341F4A4F
MIDPSMWPERRRRQVMGGYLARRRTDIGLTQAAMATRLRVSTETYASWERGVRFPSPDVLQEVFEALELPFWTMRKIQSLVFTRAHRLRLGTWPPKLSPRDFDHLESIAVPAYLHGMPQYDVYAANSKAAQLLPTLLPAPITDPQPLNLITYMLGMLTDGDKTVGNLEVVLQRLIWLLKTMGLGIAEPKRLQHIRTQCREINREAFEDMWRTELAQEVVYDPLVLLLNPTTQQYDRYTMRCKHDIHPVTEYETYVMAPEGAGDRLARAHLEPGYWAELRDPGIGR